MSKALESALLAVARMSGDGELDAIALKKFLERAARSGWDDRRPEEALEPPEFDA